MRLLVLGATGQTGQPLLSQALEQGHHVTALVRDPAKLTVTHDNLVISKCNIFEREELKSHVAEADVVISCLGFGLAWSAPVTGYLDIAKVLVECFKETGKRRFIYMHSWYTDPTAHARGGWFLRNVFLKYVIGQTLAGMKLSQEFLETTDNIDYTCILPGGLSREEVSEKPFTISDEFCYVPECPDSMIARSDVARYMLTILEDETSYKKIRAIGYTQ